MGGVRYRRACGETKERVMKRIQKIALLAAAFCAGLTNAQTTHDVAVGPGGTFTFIDTDISIMVGDTVRWTWDSGGHNVVAGLPGSPTGAFFSGAPASAGTEFSVTFDEAFVDANPAGDGVYNYHCHPHAALGMLGSVTVIPDRLCADSNSDGFVAANDFTAWISLFNMNDLRADVNQDGTVEPTDFTAWIAAFNQGAGGPTCSP